MPDPRTSIMIPQKIRPHLCCPDELTIAGIVVGPINLLYSVLLLSSTKEDPFRVKLSFSLTLHEYLCSLYDCEKKDVSRINL